jgi:hypothetical protein
MGFEAKMTGKILYLRTSNTELRKASDQNNHADMGLAPKVKQPCIRSTVTQPPMH